jgi:diguanylate cyclase (GGDEF)-like protein
MLMSLNPKEPHEHTLAGVGLALPWAMWALAHQQTGLLVFDPSGHVVFANDWLTRRLGVRSEDLQGRRLTEVFPSLIGSYFDVTLQGCQKSGFPAVLSHSLHASPLPVYQPQRVGDPAGLLKQTVHIIPMCHDTARVAGQRYTLVQVNDVTPTVRRESLLKHRVDQMHHMARVDALTGIGNRREFDETLESEIRASLRAHAPLGMVLIDIDHFKAYNDHYGHPAGDQCLREVADVLRRVVRRPRDRLARYGGEEMAVLLPGTPLNGVLEVGRDIVEQVQALGLPHVASPIGPTLTVSAGAAAVVPQSLDDAVWLVRQADEALYAAKAAGRNRLCHLTAEGAGSEPE